MLAVCRRYIPDLHYAEDVMIEGFVKVFNRLDQYRSDGSFEGWIRRVMVRQALDFLRKKQFMVFEEEVRQQGDHTPAPSDFLELEHIEALIDALPEGYRMVFVMHVVEGYKHAEIAEMLEISESTSKSQLYKARRILQQQLSDRQNRRYGTH